MHMWAVLVKITQRGYFRRGKKRKRKKRKWERVMEGGVYSVVVEVRERSGV